MGMTQAVIVIFFYFHGGLIMTQTVLVPDLPYCQDNKESIVNDYKTNKVKLGKTDLVPERIIPICVKVP